MRALGEGLPLVALETAVLTHGLPFPENLETLLAMADAVRAESAVPAVVALVAGELRVGLEAAQLERLARPGGAEKTGIADLPVLAAAGVDAGTTVAATLWAARRVGIRAFATGGIGGVHRDAAQTGDVSGDLAALARFGGCVVCSGAKVILDLPRTAQVLEALGVPVVGYGTGEFPAFVCTGSGVRLRYRVDSPEAAAAVVTARDGLGLPQAVVVAHPPPVEVALPRAALERALGAAAEEASRQEVVGAELTPFLLRRLAAVPGLGMVNANRRLLVANARLAARIAGCLARAAAA